MKLRKRKFREMKIIWGVVVLLIFWGSAINLQAQEAQVPAGPQAVAENEPPEDPNTFNINFKDVEIKDVVEYFANLTGKNFILESIPQGKITILSPGRAPKNQALTIFQAILNINRLTMVPTSIPNMYRIIPSGEAGKAPLPIYLPEEKAPTTAENFIIRFIPLSYLDVQSASTLVQPLLSREGASVLAYQPTNTLIIVDTAYNIQRIMKVLKELDIPSLQPEMEIVYLRYSSASEISGTLTQIYTEVSARSPKYGGLQTPAQPQAKPTTSAGSAPAPIKIIPESRLNALILIADRATIDEAKKIITMLDVASGEKGIIHVYYCRNAVAKELAGILSGLAGGTAGRPTPVREKSGETPLSTGPTSAVLSGGLFEGELKITADEATNSLIIIASYRDYETLMKVIEKLDIPRRQVFVEAVLLEVSMDQTRKAGVSMHAGSPLEDEGMIIGTSPVGGIDSLSLLSLLTQGVPLTSGIAIGAIGKPVEVPGTGGEVTIPSAGIILQMLASDSNVNVLSTPTILTTDNKKAVIQVGQRIPVPTGQTISTGGLSSVSVTRETVGIKLTITPQICESGTIKMDIETEISNAVPNTLGLDPNTLGVTTSLKTATTSVIVKDRQTIVIGGLIEDRRSQTSSRWPFLGDLPVIGWLFKGQQKTKTKSNLVILLTPHIVRTDEDIQRLREKYRRDYDSFIEESLGGEFKRWDEYFESQYLGTLEPAPKTEAPVIDFTKGEPEIIKPGEDTEGEKEKMESENPEQESRSEADVIVKPGTGGLKTELKEQEEQPAYPPSEPEKKKKWWQREKKEKIMEAEEKR